MDSLKKNNVIVFNWLHKLAALACLFLLFIIGCGGDSTVSRARTTSPLPKYLPPMGYTIQVGMYLCSGEVVLARETVESPPQPMINSRNKQANAASL